MRDIEELPDEESHLENSRTKVKDYEKHSLTTEERNKIIRKYNAEHSLAAEEQDVQETSSAERETLHQVKLQKVSIRKTIVESDDGLERVIKQDFPFLMERKDYDRLFNSAKSYLVLVDLFSNRKFVSSKEISKLSTSFSTSKEMIEDWLCNNRIPKLLVLLNQSLSIDEGIKLKSDIIQSLNGITSFESAQDRFETYYLWEKMQSYPTLEKFFEISKNFFRFLDKLSEGGLITDIARESGNSKEDITRWVRKRQIPSLLILVSKIPSEKPEQDFRWLPMKMKTGGLGNPEDFIQVPIRNLTVDDIFKVLHQIKPVESKAMKDHEKEFGELSREYALMYLLGASLSDGRFSYGKSIASASLTLKASKKYPWGVDFGEGFCYCLERFGISRRLKTEGVTHQKDGTNVEYNQWKSEFSPIVVWIENTLLGLRGLKPKDETPIRADWIYSLPHNWKVAFLQGISDGDGSASFKNQNVVITSKANVDFFVGLLESMGIEPTCSNIRVIINKSDSIQKLNEFPMFRYASERKEQLSHIVALLSSIKYGISEKTRRSILELDSEGFSSGEIAEKLWLEHSIAIRSSTIRSILIKSRK
jgi:hypothetical protein